MSIETFIGTLILSCIGAYFVWRNNFKVRQASAASVFRAAIDGTLSDLRNTDIDAFDILNRDFIIHQRAVNEFSMFLNRFRREAFMKAWKNYVYHEKTGIQFLEQYSSAGCSISEAKSLRKLAVDRLEHLTSYAKQT